MIEKEWVQIKVPKNSEIYKFLYIQQKYSPIAKWKILEREHKRLEDLKDPQGFVVDYLFNSFVAQMIALYPERKEFYESLRPLIIWQILHGEDLPDEYYNKLRKMRYEKKS